MQQQKKWELSGLGYVIIIIIIIIVSIIIMIIIKGLSPQRRLV